MVQHQTVQHHSVISNSGTLKATALNSGESLIMEELFWQLNIFVAIISQLYSTIIWCTINFKLRYKV